MYLPLTEEIIAGKYRVLSQIGRGGMGTVHEAVNVTTGKHVALKRIGFTRGDTDASDLALRFEREARAAGRINSAHIVQIFDTGKDDAGAPYMVMELLRGESLSELGKRLVVLEPELALRIAGQVCLGLSKAHKAGIVHRDIKPANLFLAENDANERVVKILDFGIAKVAMDQFHSVDAGDGITRTGSMLGSPRYMSPEQAKGLKTIDHRADLWSLGVVLYKMLSGRTPHEDIDSLGEVIIAICGKPSPPLTQVAPWVSRDVSDVVDRALQIEPDERFQSAAEMLNAIETLVDEGWTIRGDRVRALPDDVRDAAVHLASGEDAPSSFRNTGPTVPSPLVRTAVDERNGGITLRQAPPTSRAVDVEERTTPDKRRRSRAIGLTVGVAAAVAAGAFVVNARSTRTTVAPELSAPPPRSPQPSTAASAKPDEPSTPRATKKVSVAVEPAEVIVFIDGRGKVPVVKGEIEIEGPLGSVHHVTLEADGRVHAQTVIISEAGPSPAKLKLPADAKKRPAPSVTARAPAVRLPKPAAPKPSQEEKPASKGRLSPDTNFE